MRIEAYSLVEFVQKIEQAVKDGYGVDYDDNDSIPYGSVGYYRCKMHKGGKVAALLKPKQEPEPEADVVKEAEPEQPDNVPEPFVPSIVFEVKEPETAKKAGRPKAQRV